MLVNRDARRTLYQSLVKSQVSFAIKVWSPSQSNNKIILERIQRRATRWILKAKKGDISYKDRLLALNLLPNGGHFMKYCGGGGGRVPEAS